MAVTPGTRISFGRAMKRRRKALDGMTLRTLLEEMRERGDRLTEATLSGYERGEYAPGRERAVLLDEILGAGGELVTILGFTTEDTDELDLERIRRELDETRAAMLRLQEAVAELQAERTPSRPSTGSQ